MKAKPKPKNKVKEGMDKKHKEVVDQKHKGMGEEVSAMNKIPDTVVSRKTQQVGKKIKDKANTNKATLTNNKKQVDENVEAGMEVSDKEENRLDEKGYMTITRPAVSLFSIFCFKKYDYSIGHLL